MSQERDGTFKAEWGPAQQPEVTWTVEAMATLISINQTWLSDRGALTLFL